MQHFFQNCLLFGISFFVLSAQASESLAPCFDFSTKITTPLKPAPTQFEKGQDISKLTEGDSFDSARVSGRIEKPILALYQKLLDPRTIRADEDIEIKVKTTESKDYLKRITQSIKITPVFFITLEWNEEWVYALKEGTPEAPKSIVISFEKTSGTSHIQRLCGNYVLQSLGPTLTGVFIYEEMGADRRDAKDILNDITGTLKTLRASPSH
jgi:hypothetical protein